MFNLTNYRPAVFAACLMSLSFVACTADVGPPPTDPAGATALLNGDGLLNTYTSEWIEIDDIDGDAGSANANLFEGLDALNPDLPVGGLGPYIDWDELVDDGLGGVDTEALLNHRVLDDMGSNKDASAFPQANSCVGEASVLDKMDLTYAAIANNNDYVFIAVQRAKNNGDAAYYWLFNLDEPTLEPSASNSCASGVDLIYHIRGPSSGAGDVLVRGLFAPSADEPALEVFQATQDADVPAVDVIDIELMVNGSPLWARFEDPTPEDPTDDVVVAVNTTPTPAGHLGHADVVSVTGDMLGEHIIAEAAVPLVAFDDSGIHCGASYFVSVLSRPSHSPTSDPKDLIGPFRANFGETTAEATLENYCTQAEGVHYVATATGFDGEPLVLGPGDCSWDFGSTDCEGYYYGFGNGTHVATVTVTDTATGCSDDAATNEVTVYPDLAITAWGTNECTGDGFTVCSDATGGLEPYTFVWDVSGVTIPAQECPLHVDAAPGAYEGTVTVTDNRDCSLPATFSANAYAPIDATLSAEDYLCSSDEVRYTLSDIQGGSPPYAIAWVGCTSEPGDLSCVVNPDDNLFCASGGVSVTIGDSSGVCDTDHHAGTYERLSSYLLGCDGGAC